MVREKEAVGFKTRNDAEDFAKRVEKAFEFADPFVCTDPVRGKWTVIFEWDDTLELPERTDLD